MNRGNNLGRRTCGPISANVMPAKAGTHDTDQQKRELAWILA